MPEKELFEKQIEILCSDGQKRYFPSKELVLDVLTGEYIHADYQYSVKVPYTANIHVKGKGEFNSNDVSSWNQYEIRSGWTLESNCIEENTINVRLFAVLGGGSKEKYYVFYTKNPEELVKKMDWVRGVVNTDTYYDKRELSIMDRQKPYRPFDNTFYKKNIDAIAQVKAITTKNTTEYQQLKKSILAKNIQMGVESLTFKEFEGMKYTFGIELETSSGRLEPGEADHLNIKAVKDGSLREADGVIYGGEYVTGVLIGDAGLHQLNEICRVLNTKCSLNQKCGFHLHIGNLNWTNEDIVYSYYLAQMLEREIFSMLPKSRRSNSYCREITKLIPTDKWNLLSKSSSNIEYDTLIQKFFNSIYEEVAGEGHCEGPDRFYNKFKNHPKGPKCNYDKSSQRYCWLNYVTLMFNTKEVDNSWTLEVRNHAGTLNYNKVKNWTKVFFAFCHFVENYKNVIRDGYYTDKKGNVFPLSVELMIKLVYNKTGDKLIDYVRERKQVFLSTDESIDYVTDKKLPKKSIKEVACAL